MEEDYQQSNPNILRRNKDYSFYYDSSRRVTAVGIRNYSPVGLDTATCRFFYDGSARRPWRIIAPNLNRSTPGSIVYDTTEVDYGANGLPVSDRSNQMIAFNGSGTPVRVLVTRTYTYDAGGGRVYVYWKNASVSGGADQWLRSDTLQAAPGGGIGTLKSALAQGSFGSGDYALVEGVQYSAFVNPLSVLNISGMPFAPIYTPVTKEVLGNSWHKAAWNSNILPYYLDFLSPRVPNHFFLGGYTSGGWLIAAASDYFDLQVTPTANRPYWPSALSVGASSALGDRFSYRFYY
ncbi:MAG: hypothetical protein EOO12_08170 [Chitinophagaceae bacterium]|nr:MAG: hypothetical protein EOO12_08170 [Chitinophagaceae bacterium]